VCKGKAETRPNVAKVRLRREFEQWVWGGDGRRRPEVVEARRREVAAMVSMKG
jgi:hypothetical protein